VGFDDLAFRDPCPALECIYVLRETDAEEVVGIEQADERMCDRGAVAAWVNVFRERVERDWVLAEVVDACRRCLAGYGTGALRHLLKTSSGRSRFNRVKLACDIGVSR
jgi:hypothetical protein